MRKLFVILMLLYAFGAKAQVLQYNTTYGMGWRRLGADTLLFIPSDTLSVPAWGVSKTMLARKGGTLYYWNGTKWGPVSSDTASLSNRINLKVNISDTSSMLTPYFRKIDTASLSNRINLKQNISDTSTVDATRWWVQQQGYTTSNIYNSDGVVTGNRTVDVNNNTFTIDSASQFYIRSKYSPIFGGTEIRGGQSGGRIRNDHKVSGQYSEVNVGNGSVQLIGSSPNVSRYGFVDLTHNSGYLTMGMRHSSNTAYNSTITMRADSILLQPHQGRINIDSMRSGSSADSLLTWNASTGAIGKITVSSINENSTLQDVINNGNILNTTSIINSGDIEFYPESDGLYEFVIGKSKTYKSVGIKGTTLDLVGLSNINISADDSINFMNGVKASDTTIIKPLGISSTGKIGKLSTWPINTNSTLTIASPLTGVSYNGTSPVTIGLDTTVMSTRAWRQKGIDSVASLLSSYVPTSRQITINGTAQDLSTNRSWSVGTVTSVAAGSGLSGGTITGAGTISADTSVLSTRAWRQKGIDSVQTNVNSKVNISDTANMLTSYLRKTDTTSLSNRINLKVNISDTSTMLNNYVRHVYRKTGSDSVFLTEGAGNIFAFRDSVGGGSISAPSGAGISLVKGTTQVKRLNAGSGITVTDNTDSVTIAINEPIDYTILAYQSLGSVIKAQTVGINVSQISTTTGIGDGTAFYVPVWIPKAQTITGVKWFQAASGSYTADNYNGVGLYTYSGGTLTQVASSTDDGNIWKGGPSAWVSKAFSSTYNASAGLHYIVLLYNSSAQTTAPTIGSATLTTAAQVSNVDFTNSAKWFGTTTSSTLPNPTQAMSGVAAARNAIYVSLY